MEEQIKELMDQLALEETGELLIKDMPMKINEDAAARIRRTVLKKSGVVVATTTADSAKAGAVAAVDTETGSDLAPMATKTGTVSETGSKSDTDVGESGDSRRPGRKRNKRRRGFGVAAALLAVCLAAVALIGFEDVSAALLKAFGLAPGYGIIEVGETPVLYAVGERVTIENELVRIELLSGISTKDKISLMFKKTYLNLTLEEIEAINAKKEEASWDRKAELAEYLLRVGDVQYPMSAFHGGWGGAEEEWTVEFTVEEDTVQAGVTYYLEYPELGLLLPFVLTDYTLYESLDEIGGTQVHNDISVTAVSEQVEGGLRVELYAMNESHYDLKSYMATDEGREMYDLYLLADGQRMDYEKPTSYGSGHNYFFFPGEFTAEMELILKIPQLTVWSLETNVAKLPVPPTGEKKETDIKLSFADGDLHIYAVEKVERDETDTDGHLRAYMKFENTRSDAVFGSAYFTRFSVFGGAGGGYALMFHDDGTLDYVEYGLDAKNKKSLWLEIKFPTYYLMDEYTLRLN